VCTQRRSTKKDDVAARLGLGTKVNVPFSAFEQPIQIRHTFYSTSETMMGSELLFQDTAFKMVVETQSEMS
jgi:hypothetical protein